MVTKRLNPCGSKAGLCYLEGNKITKEGNKLKKRS
ncbi:hypothetical protein SAG0027_08145 [Streptococcus agalactiae FSL S3-251]|nr:hypothetical protein SAG0109_10355 [Streptococcus agalactiae BSU108]EPU21087.1 hypothetical protein SAG0137_01845 [Streptococcus agalactiae LMG 14838]EPU24134.1 hypothetical protein SAG0135_09000 [Streptococcus agalactiae LMG 14609]EPV93825.1 hypothetical protein SAG0027_08145 [Streptococcus agalactiae FSL S3-251]EPW71567.1 hypothetical protein SAG0101_00780 [Streptococcus agalactiae BSU451]